MKSKQFYADQSRHQAKVRKRIDRYSRGIRQFGKNEKVAMAEWMRAHPTPGEASMWAILQRRNRSYERGTPHPRWRRQAIIKGFIADFYCPFLKLVIEVDGGAHRSEAKIAYDQHRDAALGSAGIRTVRVPWPFSEKTRRIVDEILGPPPDVKMEPWMEAHFREISEARLRGRE